MKVEVAVLGSRAVSVDVKQHSKYSVLSTDVACRLDTSKPHFTWHDVDLAHGATPLEARGCTVEWSVAVACLYVCGVSLCLWLCRVAMFVAVACRYVCGISLWLWRVAMSVAVACRYVCGVSLCQWCVAMSVAVACRFVCGVSLCL